MNEDTGVSPLSNYSDGTPKEIGKVTAVKEPLKTNYKSLPQRYALAEKQVWAKLPKWKQVVILDCKTNGTEKDRVYDEYVSEIISLAECSSTIFDENLPEAPFSKARKSAVVAVENQS